MYCETNYPTKKAFREAFARGDEIRVFQPGGLFKGTITGSATIEGPHFPKPHRWYASVEIKDRIVTAIKG